MVGKPVVVYDGMDDLPDIDAVLAVPCPCCQAANVVDVAAVALRGTSIGWVRSTAAAALQDAVHAQLAFDAGEFDGKRTLRSTNDRLLAPWVEERRCPTCAARLHAVASWGEVQPARWRLVFEGLVPAEAAP